MQGIAYFIVGCVFVVCLCGKGSEIIRVLQIEMDFYLLQKGFLCSFYA